MRKSAVVYQTKELISNGFSSRPSVATFAHNYIRKRKRAKGRHALLSTFENKTQNVLRLIQKVTFQLLFPITCVQNYNYSMIVR